MYISASFSLSQLNRALLKIDFANSLEVNMPHIYDTNIDRHKPKDGCKQRLYSFCFKNLATRQV